MTAYYVASTGDNSDGLTWSKAFTTFGGAVSAASTLDDVIYVDQGFTDTIAGDATYGFNASISVICSNDKVNMPPQTLGSMGTSNWIGHSTSNYSITLNGGYRVYIYGLTFRIAGGATVDHLNINSTDAGCFELDSCYLWQGNNNSSATITIGSVSNINSFTRIVNCTLRFGSGNNTLLARQRVDFEGCTISSSGSAPTTLLPASIGILINFINCDLSHITGTLVGSQTSVPSCYVFSNCKLGSGVTVLASQSPLNKSSGHVWVFNCSSGDQHYHIGHYDAFGSTICDTGIYANDGASYDGTNRLSWKIVTNANCSYYTPYISPWIECYHSGTSAITPYLEILRDGSATDYQDDEVWGEFSYQGTSGFPLGTIVSDRKALLAAAADQADGVGTSGWTGEAASAWSGKLAPTSSITPAEIGHLRARVVVGEPSITVYVDPQIRGRS